MRRREDLPDNPLIVHIADMESLEKIVAEVPEAARKLAKAYWPGPLTMIFKKNDSVPMETTGGLTALQCVCRAIRQRLP